MSRSLCVCAFAVLLPCWAAGAASAQALSVMPVGIALAPGQSAAAISISSPDAHTSFQVRAFAWDQDRNEDQLDPTDDLILSPPLGAIAAGETQIVRLVLRYPPQKRESSYRILIDQIPPPSDPGMVRIALRLSIPVFAEPQTRVTPHLKWHVEQDHGKVFVVALNDGDRHERVRDIVVTAGGTTFQAPDGVSPYILPGATRRWELPGTQSLPESAMLHLRAELDAGRLDLLIPATSGQ